MSFIDEHADALPVVNAKQAISESIGCISSGKAYTWKIVALCGVSMGLVFWLEDSFEKAGKLGIPQVVIEAYFACIWHRFVLLRDQSMAGNTYGPFLRRTFLYYFIFFVVAIFGVAMFASFSKQLSEETLWMGLAVMGVGLLMVLPRVVLVFPALAVEGRHNKMADAFSLSTGNTVRMAISYFLVLVLVMITLLPALLGYELIDTFTTEFGIYDPIWIGQNLLMGVTSAVGVLLWAGLNSSLYRQLGGNIPNSFDAQSDEAGLIS